MSTTHEQIARQLDNVIHKVPHFPKQGVLFYDITGILTNPAAFSAATDYFIDRYRENIPSAIAAIDSRGFLFASPVAYMLKVPLILVRKLGKLPRKTIRRSFVLEYGEDTVEVNPDDISRGDNVVIFDDLLATGGTARATCDLFLSQGVVIQEVAGIIGLEFLSFKEVLNDVPIHYLVSYNTEKVE